jgi:hypothetical protein
MRKVIFLSSPAPSRASKTLEQLFVVTWAHGQENGTESLQAKNGPSEVDVCKQLA